MTTLQENRLAQFVDRVSEFKSFCELLENKQKPIMSIWGDGGLGKTSLKTRMINECARRNLRKAELVWTDIRNHDYLSIMRKIRDDVGFEYFKPFTNLVNYFTDPHYNLKITFQGSSSLADQTQFTNSSVRDMANVIIKDSMFAIPRTDIGLTANERMVRLTDQFIADLAAATENIPLVVFFDAVEKMTIETSMWVWSELLQSIADGRLSNIWLVLCGRKKLEYDAEMKVLIEEVELEPLRQSDIVDYLAKRGVEKSRRADIADTLFISTSGNPRQVAVHVDALMLMWNKGKH
jgi:hypothetical protein